jgi:hypothetical protein
LLLHEIVKNRPHRNGIAACASIVLGFLVLSASSNSSAAQIGSRDITELSIEELADIVVTPGSRPELRRAVYPAVTIHSSNTTRVQNVSYSAAFQEYNNPNPDPGIYASPGDMRFGPLPPTVEAAIRALGPGS